MFEQLKNKVDMLVNDQHMNEVVRGTLIAFILKVVGAGLAFGFNIILARKLGAEGSGIYFLALSLTTACTVIGMFGLGTSSIKYIASFSLKGQINDVQYVSVLALKFAVLFLSIISVTLFVFSDFLSLFLFSKPELSIPLRWMALAILPFGILQLFAEQLRGVRQIKKSTSLQGVVFPVINILGLLLLVDQFAILGSIFSFLMASILTVIVAFYYWRSCFPSTDIKKSIRICELLESGRLNFIGDLATRIIIPWLPFFLLGIWGTTQDVGVFGVANRTAMLTSFVLFAFNSITAPKFAALFHERDMQGLDRIAKQTTLMMMVIVTPLIFLMVYFADFIMAIFGSEFHQGALLLMVLLVGQFVNVFCGSVGYLLTMTGNESLYQRVTLFSMVVMFLISVSIIPVYGAIGAAFAVSTTIIIQNMLFAYLSYYRLGVSTLWFLKWKVNE
jgi:O-antigen/teichoic acid export membrane protein